MCWSHIGLFLLVKCQFHQLGKRLNASSNQRDLKGKPFQEGIMK